MPAPPSSCLSRFILENSNAETVDAFHFPLQSVTKVGWRQAVLRGRQLATEYAEFLSEKSGAGRESEFQVTCRASNYRRTQWTAMAVLGGLFSRLPCGNSVSASIVVRPTDSDSISVFDSGNGLSDVMAAVTRSPFYRSHERRMLAVSRELIAAVPYFQGGTVASAAASPVLHGSDRFMWIRAHDLFVTHKAHGLPLPVGDGSAASAPAADTASDTAASAASTSTAQARARITRHMHSLEHLTNEHLLWRFRTLFSVPRALALGGAGLFSEIADMFVADGQSARIGGGRRGGNNELQRNSSGSGISAPPAEQAQAQLSLLSGHDVTLLPLLYGLASISAAVWARFPSDPGSWKQLPSPADARLEVPWPVYTATLSMRLMAPGGGCAGDEPLLLWTLDNTVPDAGPDSLGVLDPYALPQGFADCVTSGPSAGASAVSQAQVEGHIRSLAAAGPPATDAGPSTAIPHLYDASACDLDLTIEDAAAGAGDGLPSHLAHKLAVLGPGGQPDTVLQMRGAVWLRDVVALAARLREISDEAQAQRQPADPSTALSHCDGAGADRSGTSWLRGLRR